jgi:phosphoglycolate phosphatase-like HAD superfamily hydrolase
MPEHRKRAYLFDFDGVILNSARIKEHGFAEMFADFNTALVGQFLAYHHANGGLSRFEKIRYFYEKIAQIPLPEGEVERRAQQFSEKMRMELKNPAYLIPDTIHFVQRLQGVAACHVVSAAEQHELRFLCQELGIAPLFNSIHGSPTPKRVLVSELLAGVPYTAQECVLIGDSLNDYHAAAENNVEFWGYNNPELRVVGRYVESFTEVAV